ncbi:guanine deaminase [Yimella sp. cx-51]|uniref:guanine deaminase n=1 Tax=Yimella sp. cx-51 TaxID=2770551 RepID=UPI00165E96FA|nr:guanine deaminase [Yimella sp. cx-51]MBC9955657.1 guanine deaminase [Yimella sp. cx-51]QTH37772.1 guanine deaminase [Yimella sp. cx-51]
MTIYRATALDTPDSPFDGAALRAGADVGLRVIDGVITHRATAGELFRQFPGEQVVDLREGVLLPGFVDTHVHFPQLRVIGALGMPLLDWLDRAALPEELQMADEHQARMVARGFLRGLREAGTTTALVFGSHFASAMEVLFTEAHASRLRIVSGLVVSDRILPEGLLTTPELAYEQSVDLAHKWHGVDRLRYAVTPRFSLSAGEEMLAACGRVMQEFDDLYFTSHLNENKREIEEVEELFGGLNYTQSYDAHGLLGGRSVLAHDVHPKDEELTLMAQRRTSVAHCPTSNSALGSGLFPLKRHVAHGVSVALGSDVGAGTGFSLFKEGLQAYFMQQLLGDDGLPLTSAHLLYLATRAGAHALEMDEEIGDLSAGKQFDAIWIRPQDGDPLDMGIEHAKDSDDVLAKIFALGTTDDVAGVWVGGERL